MESNSQRTELVTGNTESLPKKVHKEEYQPKLSKKTRARLGSTAMDVRGFLSGTPDYYEDEAAHQEYVSMKTRRREVAAVRVDYPEYYHDWQIDCLETIKKEKNVILSSPTGSGKTAVFLDWAQDKKTKAEKSGRQKHTVYITAPIKALSNQRFRELQEAGYMVGLETGDVKNVPEDADYICCTQEIYTNKYVDDENATLIVDEFHYISENPERSRAYIDGLHNSKAQNVLLCSATFGDIGTLDEYVEKVTDRSFADYENHDRLTDLEIGGYISPEEIRNALVVSFSARNCEAIADELVDLREDSDENIEGLIQEICKKHKIDNPDQRWYRGVGVYYGKMLPKEKACIEELFERRLIDTVAGTDALALGVNFPVDKVVFAQLAKFNEGVISKNLFDQLAGRAGRKGYYDKGTVYYCDSFRNDRGYPLEPREYNHVVVDNDDDYDDDYDDGYGYGRRYYGPGDFVPETEELFDELNKKDNEPIRIGLSPCIKKILQGKTTAEEEARYIYEYSNTGESYEEIEGRVKRALRFIENYTDMDTDFCSRFLPLEEKERLLEARNRYHDALYSGWVYEDDRVRTGTTVHDPLHRNGITYVYIDIVDKESGEEKSNRYSFGLTEDERIIFEPKASTFNGGLSEEKMARLVSLMQYAYDSKKAYVAKLKQEYDAISVEILPKWKKLFLQEIQLIYNDELSEEENCLLCAGLITGRGEDIFGKIEPEDGYYSWDDDDEDQNEEKGDTKPSPLIDIDENSYESLCRMRRIIMNLPSKYRKRFDIAAIEDKIASIDDTILNGGNMNPLFAASDIQELLGGQEV